MPNDYDIKTLTERDIDLIDDIETLREVAKYLLRKLDEMRNRYAIRDVSPRQDIAPGNDSVLNLEKEVAALAVEGEDDYPEDFRRLSELLEKLHESHDPGIEREIKRMILDLKVRISRRRRIEGYLVTIRKWDEMGYNVNPLIDMINSGQVGDLDATMETYKAGIQKIEKIKSAIANMDIPPQLFHMVDAIKSKISDPRNAPEVERIFNELMEEKIRVDMRYRQYAPENRNYRLNDYIGDGEAYNMIMKVLSGELPPAVIYLYGKPSTGKSHLLVGLYNALEENGKRPLYVRAKDLASMDSDKLDEIKTLSRYILVDEINTGDKKVLNLLCDLIDFATDSGKYLIMAGRLTPRGIENISPRLNDRLTLMSVTEVTPMPMEIFKSMAMEILSHYGDELPGNYIDMIVENTYPDPMNLKKKITEILATKALTGSITEERIKRILDIESKN